jgi:lipopolysaccharide heptosyltransferase II
MKPNKILFFKLGAIGDVIMTTPLIRQTKKSFPTAKIDYLVGEYSAPVLEGNKYLNKIIRFDEKTFVKMYIFSWLWLIGKIRRRHYDLVFVLDRHWIFNLTAYLAGIRTRVGFDRLGKEGKFLTHKVYYGPPRHDIYCYLDLLKALGGMVNYKDWKEDLFLTIKDRAFALTYWKKHNLRGRKVIAIAPGGAINPAQSLPAKIWPTDRYVELIRRLKKKGYEIVLIGAATDKGFEKQIIQKVNVLSLIGKTNIKQSAAIMQKASLVICNDSGPMHIAETVNKKIISLFGPTDPRKLAPLWKESKYLWKLKKPTYDVYGKHRGSGNEINKITVEDVLRCIK